MKHVIVAQGDARRLVRVRAPLAVGIARFQTRDVPAAVVVKATLSLAGGTSEEVKARFVDPDPVCKPQPSELADGVWASPDDFVARKPKADVVVTGHAHAREPSSKIDVGIRLGNFSRSLSAVARDPTRAIPLVMAHLREHAGHAPTPLYARTCEREGDDDGGDDFDFTRLQGAQSNMQTPSLDLEAPLELTGLSPRADTRVVHFPAVQPAVWYDRHPAELTPLRLTCDTLVVDSDYEKVTLVWRGPLPEGVHPDQIDRLMVTLVPIDDEATPEEVLDGALRGFSRGTVSFATEEDPSQARRAPDPDELEMARYELLEFAADPQLDMNDFARVAAVLAEQKRDRAAVLGDAGFDERTWLVEERAWSERVAQAQRTPPRDGTAADGSGNELAEELATSMLNAQDALAGPLEPRTLEEYAMLRRALDNSEKPQDMLLAQNMGLGEWARLERHWLKRAETDTAVWAELRELLADVDALISEA